MRKYMTPCPSPRGTNTERLFLVRRPAAMALDAAPPLDDNGADAYEALAKILQQNLSPDVLAEAETLLQRFVDQSGSGTEVATDDEPSAISGRPGAAQSPRAMTMDERLATGARIRAGKALAQQFLFNKRYRGQGVGC
jgi:hypothetical protein